MTPNLNMKWTSLGDRAIGMGAYKIEPVGPPPIYQNPLGETGWILTYQQQPMGFHHDHENAIRAAELHQVAMWAVSQTLLHRPKWYARADCLKTLGDERIETPPIELWTGQIYPTTDDGSEPKCFMVYQGNSLLAVMMKRGDAEAFADAVYAPIRERVAAEIAAADERAAKLEAQQKAEIDAYKAKLAERRAKRAEAKAARQAEKDAEAAKAQADAKPAGRKRKAKAATK